MRTQISGKFFFWLVGALFTDAAGATGCRNILLGDFAVKKNDRAVLRIEEINGEVVSRQKHKEGGWDTHFEQARLMSKYDLEKFFGNEKLAEKSCGLGVVGVGMLLKLPIGQKYKVSSLTERSFDTKAVKSGYLVYVAQGFAVSALDVYPVARQGVSPPVPAQRPKAVVGQEVPATATCPGDLLPDMTQTAFNALPPAYRSWYHQQNADAQLRFVCGQYLDGLMRNHRRNHDYDFTYEDLGPKLEQLDLLLDAKQIPRDPGGSKNWWKSTWFLLSRDHIDLEPPRTGEAEVASSVHMLFDQKILPRLDLLASGEVDPFLLPLVEEALLLPNDLGMRSLKKFNANGVLQSKSEDDRYPNHATKLLETMGISQAKFDYLLGEAGPAAVNNRWLMLAKIGQTDVEGVRRLLSAGANPAQDLLAVAKGQDAEIYRLMSQAARNFPTPAVDATEKAQLPANK